MSPHDTPEASHPSILIENWPPVGFFSSASINELFIEAYHAYRSSQETVTFPLRTLLNGMAEMQLHRMAFDRSPILMAIFDPQGRFIMANQASLAAQGLNSADVIGKRWPEIGWDERVGEEFDNRIATVVETGGELAARITTESSSWLAIYTPLKNLGSTTVQLVLATYADTSDLIAAEESATENEKRYRIISELTSDYAYASKAMPDGRLVTQWISAAFQERLGYTIDELNQTADPVSIIHPDDIPIMLKRGAKLLACERDISVYRVVTKSGAVLTVRDYGFGELDADGVTVNIFGAAQDITNEHTISEALKTSEGQLRALLNSTPQAIFFLDKDCKIVMLNRLALEDISTNWPLKDFVHGAHMSEYLFDQYKLLFTEGFHKALDGQRTTMVNEINLERGTVWYESIFIPIRDGTDILGVAFSNTNVTDRVTAERLRFEQERQLVLAQKEAELARLAAGIAHDVRNLLASVHGYSELGEQAETLLEAQEFFRLIKQACAPVTALITQLLNLGTALKADLKPIYIDDVIFSAISGIRAQQEYEKVEINVLSRETALPQAIADNKLLMSTFTNILRNSMNATLALKDISPLPPIEVSYQLVGDEIEFIFADQGVGIPAENIGKIFEPYFSTSGKTTEKGVGFGMAMLKRVIDLHNGRIQIVTTVQPSPEQADQFIVSTWDRGNTKSVSLTDPSLRTGTTITIRIPFIKPEGFQAENV